MAKTTGGPGTLAKWLRNLKPGKGGTIYFFDEGLNGGEWLPVHEFQIDPQRDLVWVVTESWFGGIPADEFPVAAR